MFPSTTNMVLSPQDREESTSGNQILHKLNQQPLSDLGLNSTRCAFSRKKYIPLISFAQVFFTNRLCTHYLL